MIEVAIQLLKVDRVDLAQVLEYDAEAHARGDALANRLHPRPELSCNDKRLRALL